MLKKNKSVCKLSLANKLNDPPLCSKKAQNKIDSRINTSAASIFLFSSQPSLSISYIKYIRVAGPITYIKISV